MAGFQEISGLPAEQSPRAYLNHELLEWLRFCNIALGAGTVFMAFRITRLVVRDEQSALIGAALVAFLPGFVSYSAFVTNDNLVDLLGAIFVYFALRFTRSTTTGWMLATGAVFGLLVTTKLSVLPLALLVPLLALMAPTWRSSALALRVRMASRASLWPRGT